MKWINIENKKPTEKDGLLLIKNANGFMELAYYSDEEKEILKPWRYDEDDRPALKLSGVVKWFKINLIENE